MTGKSAIVVFDMDGVLIDVSSSYREVVRLSVAAYLRAVIGADSIPWDLLSPADVDSVKKAGGFNNDWDLTCAIIDLLLRRYFDSLNGRFAGPGSAAEEAARCGSDDRAFALARSMAGRFDTRALVAGSRVKPVRALYAEEIRGNRADAAPKSPFLFDHGDVGSGNLVKRIFQELYLGPELFEEIYGMRTLFDRAVPDLERIEGAAAGAAPSRAGRAFIDREKLIPSTAHLVELASLGTLAIATGRPGIEARYPLKKFGISHLFGAVVSEDDIAAAEKSAGRSLRKPDPFSVALAIERCRSASAGSGGRVSADPRAPQAVEGFAPEGAREGGVFFYIGDMPGDMTAALGAGARPLGFVQEKGDRRLDDVQEEPMRYRDLLLGAGAERVFADYEAIVAYVKNAV